MSGIDRSFPPGPSQLPLLGNVHNVKSRELHKALWDHREKYGKLSYMRLGGRNIIALHTLEAVRAAFELPEMNDRPESFFSKYVLQGDIASQPYSEDWHNLRLVAHKGVMSTLEEGSKDIYAALNDEFEHLKSALRERNEDSFDPRSILSLSVFNSVIITLVGRRYKYDHTVFRYFSEFEKQAEYLFSNTARVILDVLPSLRYMPFWYGASFRKILQAKANLARVLLYDIKEESEFDRETKTGLIYELLRAASKDGSGMKDENIESIILDGYSAGVTSVRATVFALIYHLLHHPKVQTEIYREIVEVIGEAETPRDEHEVRMPYTQAVIRESMRMTTVVPGGVPRCNSADITLLDYRIPKNTLFLANLWRIHHDEELWEDPWCFKPGRFLDEHGNLLPVDHPSMQSVIPFGVGSRSCLGELFTKSRVFLYVANLCQSFEFYNNDSEELGSEVDPRGYSRNVVMYVPPYKIRVRERQSVN